MEKILISGGSGLIGKSLTKLLKANGYQVAILTRNKLKLPNHYYWNPKENYIDEESIKSTDYIIHLAGANIFEQRWTRKRKGILINSRVQTANLLFEKVKQLNPNLKAFISASGIGYYGAITTAKIFSEEEKPANDFISQICVKWEAAAQQFETIDCRTVIFRTGVVFAKENSAFQKMILPIKYGIGAILGNGKQYMPWIHIDDLCNLYLTAINHSLNGIYNAVSPEKITNKELTIKIGKKLNRTILLPAIPKWILKIILGQRANILLEGSRISSKKTKNIPFKFKFKIIDEALTSLID